MTLPQPYKVGIAMVGQPGPEGPVGPGVPNGGTVGQVLAKVDSLDQHTQWTDPAAPSALTPAALSAVGAVGAATAYARADHAHPDPTWRPSDHGFVSWPYDPVCVGGAGAFPVGQLMMVRLHVPVAGVLRGIHTYVTTAGAGLTAGQCFAGLYSADMVLRAQSADQSVAWASINVKRMDFTAAYNATPGDYYAALLWNGTTGPQFPRSATGNTVFTTNLSGNLARFAASLGPFTALPNPAPAVGAGTAGYWWALY